MMVLGIIFCGFFVGMVKIEFVVEIVWIWIYE